MKYLKIKQDVLDYTLLSYSEKMFAGTSGNLSIYDRENGVMAITPSSVSYNTMTIDDIMVTDLDGNIIEGIHKPSSEWRLHAIIYKEMPHINSVVHTHSPYATSFAVSHEIIPVILIEMVPFLGGDVPLAKFGLPGTDDVGTFAIDAISGRNSCLLANHGALAVGETIDKAYIRSVYVEDAAKIYHYAKLNGKVHVMEQKYIDAMLDRMKG